MKGVLSMDNAKKFLGVPLAAGLAVVGTALPTFAEGTTITSLVTASDFTGLTTILQNDIPTLVQVAVPLMAIMIGVSVIPRVIRTFI